MGQRARLRKWAHTHVVRREEDKGTAGSGQSGHANEDESLQQNTELAEDEAYLYEYEVIPPSPGFLVRQSVTAAY